MSASLRFVRATVPFVIVLFIGHTEDSYCLGVDEGPDLRPKPAATRPGGPAGIAPLASFVAHERAGSFVLFSPDGGRLISGGSDNQVQIWDMRRGEIERTLLGHGYGVKCGALRQDGKLLVTGGWDQTVRVWDIDTGEPQKPMRGHTDAVEAVALSPDGKTIISGGSDRIFCLWNVGSREMTFTSPVHELPVNRVTFSPDGKLFATGTGKGTEWKRAGEVKLWDARTGEELAALPGHSACVNTVVFSPDGEQLATGTADGMLRVWDVRKRAELSATNLRSGVRSIAFLADDETLALGQWPGRVFLWDLPTRQRGQAFAGHEKADAMVDHIAISPDGSLLASTGTDGMIYLWPVPEFGADGKRSLRPKPSSGKMASADLVRKWKSNSRDNAPAGKDGRKD